MTVKEKLSMFFETILEQVEQIENKEIREKALQGLLSQTEYQLSNIKSYINKTKTKGE